MSPTVRRQRFYDLRCLPVSASRWYDGSPTSTWYATTRWFLTKSQSGADDYSLWDLDENSAKATLTLSPLAGYQGEPEIDPITSVLSVQLQEGNEVAKVRTWSLKGPYVLIRTVQHVPGAQVRQRSEFALIDDPDGPRILIEDATDFDGRPPDNWMNFVVQHDRWLLGLSPQRIRYWDLMHTLDAEGHEIIDLPVGVDSWKFLDEERLAFWGPSCGFSVAWVSSQSAASKGADLETPWRIRAQLTIGEALRSHAFLNGDWLCALGDQGGVFLCNLTIPDTNVTNKIYQLPKAPSKAARMFTSTTAFGMHDPASGIALAWRLVQFLE